jgi:hypothetical protein
MGVPGSNGEFPDNLRQQRRGVFATVSSFPATGGVGSADKRDLCAHLFPISGQSVESARAVGAGWRSWPTGGVEIAGNSASLAIIVERFSHLVIRRSWQQGVCW